MNSNKVILTLDHWNGDWVQGRQVQRVYKSDDPMRPKELQYYIAESKDLAAGYVRNRSYNIWTNRISNSCESLEGEVGFEDPLLNFYLYNWDDGNRNLFVYPLEKNTYYTIRWYDFLTGTEFFNQTYQSKGDGRFRLEHPLLHFATRPILWFSMEKATSQRVSEGDINKDSNPRFQDIFVYPNPFVEIFNVYFEYEDDIEIYNAMGEEVGRFKLNAGETRIDLKNCASGIYFVHSMLTGEVIKIVKQ